MSRLATIIVLVLISLTLVGCSSTPTAAAITPPEYIAQYVDSATPHLLVDVRTPQEFDGGFIAGAVNIPLQELESRLSEIPHDIPVVVYCQSGNRSTQAAAILTEQGYTNIYNLGGINQWQAAGNPVVQES
jgi:phage shock protein E